MADRQKFNFGRPMVSQTNVKANEEVNVPEHLEKLRSIDQKEKEFLISNIYPDPRSGKTKRIIIRKIRLKNLKTLSCILDYSKT